MTTFLPELNRTPDEIALAERLGRESQDRIADRVRRGTPFLTSVKIEADYIAEAWAHYDDKVQIRAIRIAFDEFYRRYPKKPGCSL
jgi:hypothetical protein